MGALGDVKLTSKRRIVTPVNAATAKSAVEHCWGVRKKDPHAAQALTIGLCRPQGPEMYAGSERH